MRFLAVPFLLFALHAHAEKNLIYCSAAAPGSFNPQQSADQPTFIATTATIYDRLLIYRNGEDKPEPMLAEAWTVSKDGKTYTFKLRKGVKFQTTDTFKPTRDFNAEDVAFTFAKWAQKDAGFMSGVIQTVKPKKTGEVQFILKRPHAPFLADLSQAAAVMLSKEYGDKLEKAGMASTINSTPVGTGPFILKRYIKDESIQYEANPSYWRGRAKLDKLTIRIVPSIKERRKLFHAGECHLLDEAVADMPGVQSHHQTGVNVAYLAFNTQKPPFDNLEFRRAVAAALDKTAYIEKIYLGQAQKAVTPVPPNLWGATQDVETIPASRELAKQMLTKAGYTSNMEFELWTLPVSRTYIPDGRRLGELMQSDLAAAGIKTRLVTYDWPTYLEKTRNGEFQMAQLGWAGESPDPHGFLGTLLTCDAVKSGMNVARWCNPEFDREIEKARQSRDPKVRTAAYAAAQRIFASELPWIPLVHATLQRASAPAVTGYKPDPFGLEDFYALDLNL